MKFRLGWKLAIIYLLLITLSMGAFGYFTMRFFEETYLNYEKAALFTHANIAATNSAPFLREDENHPYLYALVREQAERVGTRYMILNKSGKVVADSAQHFTGRIIGHAEVIGALQGENQANPYYEEEFGWVLYLAVPVYSGKQVIGAVFLSANITGLVAQLDEIREKLFIISLISGIVVFLLSLALGKFITIPIGRLTRAAQRIATGDYGYQVNTSRSRDELGELTTAFNEMSSKIKAEDTIRKEFVANASHELKSPIASLKALLESWPKEGSLNKEEQAELARDLMFEADRLGKLVDDLLVLSRIEGKRNELNLEETSVGELVEAVKRASMPLAQQKSIVMETIHHGDIYWRLDGEKVFRALLNLTDNAVKYSPSESTVVIGFRVENENLVVFVEDQGEGMPESEIPHIFERFYRLDKARSRKTGGWGLGLAIVREITELHQGTIEVKSRLGKGSKFIIKIPRI